MQEKSVEHELKIEDDYRRSKENQKRRYFFPLHKETNFKINKFFRTITKDKIQLDKILNIKGREQADLISRQFLALQDRKFKYQDYIHQVIDDEDTTVSIDFELMQRDVKKVLVA